jgi:periplasmic protein TonB
MFADSLCDSTWAQTSRRGWTTLASFALQVLAVGVLLLLPLLYTEGLPRLKLLSGSLPVPAPAPPPGPRQPVAHHPHTQSNVVDGHVVAPPTIPGQIASIHDEAPLAPISGNDLGVIGSTGDPRAHGILGSIGNAPVNVAPPPPPPPNRLPRPSSMMQGYLVHRVEPIYPPLARAARIQGQVRLQAIISRAGRIENLQVLSGHPMLVQAAIDAVRQWRYRPYILNGDPVEVETQVTVNFVLSGS